MASSGRFFDNDSRLATRCTIGPDGRPVSTGVRGLVIKRGLTVIVGLTGDSSNDNANGSSTVSAIANLLTPIFKGLASIICALGWIPDSSVTDPPYPFFGLGEWGVGWGGGIRGVRLRSILPRIFTRHRSLRSRV